MACNYLYNGQELTKEELINLLASGMLAESSGEIFKSVATSKKQKRSNVTSDTLTLLYQRKKQALDVIQAVDNSNASKAEKLQKKATYKNIIEKTDASIKKLIDTDPNYQLDVILDQAVIDAEMVQAMYTNKSITFGELQFANTVVESWKSLPEVLGVTDIFDPSLDPVISKKLQEISNTYNLLGERSHAIAVQLIKKAAKGKLSTEDITRLVDTTGATEWTRELGTAGVALPNHLAYIIKETSMAINREHNQNYSMIDKMTSGIKNFDLFIKKTKNKKGEDDLSLVTRYSNTFWQNRGSAIRNKNKKLKEAGDDKAKRTAAWKEFHAWTELNTVPFNALLFINTADYTDAQRDAEIERMKKEGFNKAEIDDMIVQSIKRYEIYLNKKDEQQYLFLEKAATDPSIIPTGVTIDEYVKAKVEEYDNIHNPLKYLQQKFFGDGKVTAWGGHENTYFIPAKTIKGKDTGYYDENFAKIAADPKLFEFYQWFTQFMEDCMSWFPQEERVLGRNFLPSIAAAAAKEYGFTNLKESVSGLGDWFFNALTVQSFEEKTKVNPFSKKEIREFNARFVDENIAVEQRSTDLRLIAKIFSDMMLVYKHKNSVKAQVDTVNDVIQNTRGSYKFDKNINMWVRQEKDAKRIQSLAEYTVRSGFYGIKSEDILPKSDELFYHWMELIPLLGYRSDKAKMAQALSDDIKKYNEALEQGNLSDKERETIEAARNEKLDSYYKLGGRRFSATKAIDSAINNTRLVALGFAPFAAARNLLVGKINNNLHATGGRDFDKKDLAWANGKLKAVTANYWTRGKYENEDTRKIFGLMSDSGMAEGEDAMYLRSMIDKDTPLNKFREMLPKAYTWLSGGDYHFKAEMMLSAMKHDKIKLANDEEVSFYEAITEDRAFNKEKYGEWDAAKNGNMTFDEFYIKHMVKYRQLASKLHGASGRDIYIKGKSNALTRLLFMFKSWLPETVGVRFDPKHTDAYLDREEEGYYRTFGKLVIEKKSGVLKMIFNAMTGKDIGITNEMQLTNFKKAVKELQVITSLFIAYLMLKALAPDDDEKKKIYNLLVLRQLHDLNRDLTYYISIDSVAELQRRPIPIINTVQNWGEAIKAATYYGFGVEDKDGDLKYDSERTALKISKVLPVFSNLNRIVYYRKQID
jgi:hypothetical protein